MQPKKERILIVDDQPVNIHVLSGALKEYERVAATSGQQALEMAKSSPQPDLILLDIMMPEMDGFEVCKRLKEDPATRDIGVIFVTALGEVENEALGLELGAVDYIAKPFQVITVQARVKIHLELRRARKELELQNSILQDNAQLREHVERLARHDLKTPLNGIIGLPEVLLEQGNLTQEQQKILNMIIDSGHRMLNQINESMNLYKIETGSYVFTPKKVDLAELMNKVVQSLSPKAQSRAVSIKMSPNEQKPPIVQAEEELCFTVFSNLLDNAVEASPRGEDVRVHIQAEANNMVVSIYNTGAVPEKIRNTVFEKYTTANKSCGTGLGAYSAQLLSQAQGATVELISDDQNSTTTRICFPI